MISEETRQFVQQRASRRCEYCLSHQHYVMGKLQVDHIHPVAKGGVDDRDNLCLACELCNQYKWTRTHGFDPMTRTQAPCLIRAHKNGLIIFAGVKLVTRSSVAQQLAVLQSLFYT